jgi:hypothetical protein
MNKMNNKFVCIITCLFLHALVLAQNKTQKGTGEVSEIIIPTSAAITNNFNLFYEIHLSRETIPTPSFWYKIIFNKACSFEFTLFPIIEDDGYDFYFFKVLSNYDYCTALKEEKIISCNASRIHKVYNNTEQSEKFRANLVDVAPITVDAGDAIYIEVFSTKGNDCGHILDFRTTENSFIVKVVNDHCAGINSSDTTKVEKYKPLVADEKQAMSLLSNVLCPTDKKPVFVSSIQVNNKNVRVQKKLNFADYSKAEAPKYQKPVTVSTPKISEKEKKDSVIVTSQTIPLEPIKQKEIPIVDTQKVMYAVKSTADLNSKDEPTAKIKNETFIIKSDNERNSTRLEVDNALFSLLREDLKRKTKSLDEQLKEYGELLKKSKGSEKESAAAELQETKDYKLKLQGQLKDTDNKLKRITKLLRTEQHKNTKAEESVFAKNTTNVDQELPKGLVYKVQVGVYKNAISTDVFKGLTPVYGEVFTGGIRYSVGSFSKFYDAQQAKEYIKNMGLADAFVIAYYDKQRISIELAKLYEKK